MLQLDRHVPSPGVPEFNRRFRWLVTVVAAAFVIMIGRLWQLQVVRGEHYLAESTENFRSEQWIPAVRGKILDKNGKVLVDNRPSFNVYVTPRYFTEEARARFIRLLALDEDEAGALASKVARARSRDRLHGVLVMEDIDRDRLALIEQSGQELPGVAAEDAPHRSYLHGRLAAHLLGFMNQIGDAELEAKKADGYEEGDYVGRAGLERQWESYLRGKRGVERFVVDARGLRQPDAESIGLLDGPRLVPPVAGNNLVLTLDGDLQAFVEKSLEVWPAGAAAVVEVKTGRILALASRPAFDPNVMTGRLTRAEEAMLETDPLKPFLDRTLRQHYFPGSTFKVVTALAGLEAGAITAGDHVFCNGSHQLGKRIFHCHKSHGSVDLTAALAQSCDTYFWETAERIGIDRIAEMGQAFGFGTPTGIGLNGDVPGLVPTKAWYDGRGGMRPGYALNTAIGQGDVTVSVLQLAMAYAAIANGGDLYVPQIALRVESAAGKTVADFPPRLRGRLPVSARSLALVQRGLFATVNEKKGTAYASRDKDVLVAGKTGTAQVGKLYRKVKEVDWDPSQDHAWFAGYAPADKPEIAFVVLLEHAGHGGAVAGPPAMKIVRAALGLAPLADESAEVAP